MVASLWLVGCVDRTSSGAETETGADETTLPTGDSCTLELLWHTTLSTPSGAPSRRHMFEGSAAGGFFLALTDGEREVYVLRRHAADGSLLWAVDTYVELTSDVIDMLELQDGSLAIVTPRYVPMNGDGGYAEVRTATGELAWTHSSGGTAWEVIGPQEPNAFVCAGSFAYSWSDTSGMSTGIYDGENPWISASWDPDTSRRLVALLGFDGHTWVVDRGCAIDELDATTGLPVPWAACADPPASWSMLERLAGGQLLAGGSRSSGEATRPTVQMFGSAGEPLSSWTASEDSYLSDLSALPGGGVVVAGPDRLWVLDAQLELVSECGLEFGASSLVGIGHVAVDDHGTVLVQLTGTTADGSERLMVARVDGLID